MHAQVMHEARWTEYHVLIAAQNGSNKVDVM